MSHRQKIYVGLAISAGVCTGIAVFLYLRQRRQIALSKAPDDKSRSLTPASIIASLKSPRGRDYNEITSVDSNQSSVESVRFQSGGANFEVNIPGGGAALTPEQAIVLVRFLDEINGDIERLNRILTNIANAATFTESQVNLTNAGCIERLRELLSSVENETTTYKILLALNNLALNDYTISHFSGLVLNVINLCRTTPSKSLVRLYGLNLLVNMSVLEHLHSEYMKNITDLGQLIESTFDNNEEALSAGKILVNLSTNKSNLETLLKLTGIDMKTIVNICTPKKKSVDTDESTKLEDILLRYLTFYCNLAEITVNDLKLGTTNESNMLLYDPIPYGENAVYFELFDHGKQMSTKSILRPQYSSPSVNNQIKRLRQSLDTIRQIQFESSVSSVQDEFNESDHVQSPSITDSSTPKKVTPVSDNESPTQNTFENFEKDINDEFADDDTILPGETTPSDQSLASFRSAYSTNENNTFTSPEKSHST
ncbi:unnamed protein product [Adineta ricciae]|uniref:Armadillo repeat-containing domain-containing protein n=2 Tax=Adineta ricciae TaxID=249248 RepID=A0A814CRG8_ADIRI|nr:unnamed protein product [Adineta ricciae]